MYHKYTTGQTDFALNCNFNVSNNIVILVDVFVDSIHQIYYLKKMFRLLFVLFLTL